MSGADGYRLSVSLVSDFGCCLLVDVVDVSDTSYSFFDLVPGSRYYYKVSSIKNVYQYSSDPFVGSVLLYPGVPILRDSRYVSGGVELGWRYTSVSDSCLLQVSRDGTFSDLVAGYSGVGLSVVGASIVVRDIGSGIGMYYYRVASVNATGMSDYSESKSFINIAPPRLLASSYHREDGFRVNWELDDGIDSVILELSSSRYFHDDIVVIVLSGDSSSHILSGLSHSSSYYYTLRSKEFDYLSLHSEVGEAMTLPPYIRSLDAVIIGSRSYVARWVSSSGDISYELDISEDSNFVSYDVVEIDSSASRDYYDIVFGDTMRLRYAEGYEEVEGNDMGRLYSTSDEVYRYLILSEDKSEVLDTISVSISSIYYDIDGVVIDTLDELNLYYDNFTSISSSAYWLVPLERKGFSFYSLDSGFHNVGGLFPGVDYYYRIRSRNSFGLYSRYSEVVRVVTLPEVMALPATEVSNNGFVANWRGIGVSVYRLEVSSDLSFQRPVVFDNLDSMDYNVDGLVSGSDYHYRVVGYNEVGDPSYGSNIISASLEVDTTMMDTTDVPIMTGNDVITGWSCDIYPNPMVDDVHVDLINNYRGELSYRIHSSSGSVVLNGVFYKDSDKLSFVIDVSALSSGVYIVELTMESDRDYYKVIKN